MHMRMRKRKIAATAADPILPAKPPADVKVIGEGSFGQVFDLGKTVVKRLRVAHAESDLDDLSTNIGRELECFKWVDTLGQDDARFFAKMKRYALVDGLTPFISGPHEMIIRQEARKLHGGRRQGPINPAALERLIKSTLGLDIEMEKKAGVWMQLVGHERNGETPVFPLVVHQMLHDVIKALTVMRHAGKKTHGDVAGRNIFTEGARFGLLDYGQVDSLELFPMSSVRSNEFRQESFDLEYDLLFGVLHLILEPFKGNHDHDIEHSMALDMLLFKVPNYALAEIPATKRKQMAVDMTVFFGKYLPAEVRTFVETAVVTKKLEEVMERKFRMFLLAQLYANNYQGFVKHVCAEDKPEWHPVDPKVCAVVLANLRELESGKLLKETILAMADKGIAFQPLDVYPTWEGIHLTVEKTKLVNRHVRGAGVKDDSVVRAFGLIEPIVFVVFHLLARQGKIDLNASLFDASPVTRRIKGSKKIKVLDLLYHKSGIPDVVRLVSHDRSSGFHTKDFQSFSPNIAAAILRTEYKTRNPGLFDPENQTDYLLLVAIAISRLQTPQKFEDYVFKHVFAPLGMRKTGFLGSLTFTPPLESDGKSAAVLEKTPYLLLTSLVDYKKFWFGGMDRLLGADFNLRETPWFNKGRLMVLGKGDFSTDFWNTSVAPKPYLECVVSLTECTRWMDTNNGWLSHCRRHTPEILA